MDFDNVTFGEAIVTPKIVQWKDLNTDIYRINKKTLMNGKYSTIFILDLENRKGDKYRVFTTKAITDFLHNNNPRFMKVAKNSDDYNIASFSR